MKNICLGLLAAAALLPAVAGAASPDRVSPCQREVRAALIERGWDITQDESGKLVAERLRLDQGGTTGFHLVGTLNSFAHLEIDFGTDGKNSAPGAAYASLRTYGPLNKSYLLYPAVALHDPKLTQEYREIVAEAQARLSAASNRVAMK